MTSDTITREELLEFIGGKKGKYVLIDVREEHELALGMIPTAHSVPLSEMEEAIDMDANEFKKKFKFPKPAKTDNVFFYCRSGGRSSQATEFAREKGYSARNYEGSVAEWARYDENVKFY